MTTSVRRGVVGGRHSSAGKEHYTPPAIVDAARATLGAIDLDPASCPSANKIVLAEKFFSRRENGLGRLWWGRVFCNPPGGLVGRASSQALWWRKLASQWSTGFVGSGVFVCFSLELLQVAQQRAPEGLPLPSDLPLCIPLRRVAYHKRVGRALVKSASPPHASAIVFLPPRGSRSDADEAIDRFRENFAPFGAIVVNACPMFGR